jgi:hypothetical protein
MSRREVGLRFQVTLTLLILYAHLTPFATLIGLTRVVAKDRSDCKRLAPPSAGFNEYA